MGSFKKFNFFFINLFFLTIVIFFSLILWKGNGVQSFFIVAFFTLVTFLFAIWHSFRKLSVKNALIFLILAGLVSFIAEVIGVNFGYNFGGYSYSDLLGKKILGVPILVSLMWISIIYISYQVAEHITNFRFTKRTLIIARFWLSFWCAFLTALAVVAWDLALDPLAVKLGWWTWLRGGEYFGVPLGNFMGWIFIPFISVFIYKLFFEKEESAEETTLDYIPVISYAILSFLTILMALSINETFFAFMAFVGMFPFISIMIIRFLVVQLKFPEQYRR